MLCRFPGSGAVRGVGWWRRHVHWTALLLSESPSSGDPEVSSTLSQAREIQQQREWRESLLVTDPGSSLEGFQGGEHEFTEAKVREMHCDVAEAEAFQGDSRISTMPHGLRHASPHGEEMPPPVKGMTGADDDIDHILGYNSGTTVSLYSVMQSNVPEPFKPGNRSPTNLNMPGGGQVLKAKYTSSELHNTHPSKKHYSTSTRLYAQAISATESYITVQDILKVEHPTPQGVQGMDCDRFKLWLENCSCYVFTNCDEQLQGIQSGRKTLSEIFTEQDQLIKEIAEQYKLQMSVSSQIEQSAEPSGGEPSSLSGPTQQDRQTFDNSCPQGVQGYECERFQLWLDNCAKYGLSNCEDQLEEVQSGRKTLNQIFAEQDELIANIAATFKSGKLSTSSCANEVGNSGRGTRVSNSHGSQGANCSGSSSSGCNPNKPDKEMPLTQRQKLKRAVKDYGATVVVFHVGISLMSLGGFYVAVSSGIDVVGLLSQLEFAKPILESRLAAGASTFVVAYSVHKVFAPVRIGITLTCTPFIVHHLRRLRVLKPPKAVQKT